ncbi:hypothetical protein JRQ81_008281 [Phrynocephalus forsythii]|uniref:Reverse transcriptase n=1 Tax=Phrynocephalus forsythii TaxID=171643 RepID=A0A9Q0XBQ7_9SAUR|nr:hypothetical protein JRQ81_008281 [Phrynocephalus forsythii]
MDTVTRDLQNPVSWTRFYTDDVTTASEIKADLQCRGHVWSDCRRRFGLRLNVRKAEYLTTDTKRMWHHPN